MLFYEQQLVINVNPFKCQPHKFTFINLVLTMYRFLKIMPLKEGWRLGQLIFDIHVPRNTLYQLILPPD